MEKHSGFLVVAEVVIELERILEAVPPKHRGLLFERVLWNFNSQRGTQRLELAFAKEWAERNNERHNNFILCSLLETIDSDPQKDFVPRNEREWKVAQLVAATLIQWLPTSGGCSFLHEAFEKGGGKFNYKLPADETENNTP